MLGDVSPLALPVVCVLCDGPSFFFVQNPGENVGRSTDKQDCERDTERVADVFVRCVGRGWLTGAWESVAADRVIGRRLFLVLRGVRLSAAVAAFLFF